jgi:hypothetical protein
MRRTTGGDVPLTAFLFDHMFLMTKERGDRKVEGEAPSGILKAKTYQFQVYKRVCAALL